MGTIASQITSLTIVYSTLYSGADQRKHQSSASLAFVWGIHRGPVNSPHKGPVTRKMFPFDDIIMAGSPVCIMKLALFEHILYVSWKQVSTSNGLIHWSGVADLDAILKKRFSILFYWLVSSHLLNTLRPRQDGRHFADDIFKCIFLEWKCLNSDYNFTEVCSQGSN